MLTRFTYRAMFVLSAISLVSPIALAALRFFAKNVAPESAPRTAEFPIPFSSLESVGSNPVLFGAFFPAFNVIVKAMLVSLVLHRLFCFVRHRTFMVPVTFGGTLLFVSQIGCVSFLASFFMIAIAFFLPSFGHLAQVAVPVSMGMLFLPLTFAASELLLIRDGTFHRSAFGVREHTFMMSNKLRNGFQFEADSCG
jgi:hypothetical protein